MTDRKLHVDLEMDIEGVTSKAEPAKAVINSIDEKVDELNRDMGKLDRQVDQTGRKFVETAVEAGVLNAELAKTRQRIKDLGTEFDRTGEKDLLPQIRQARTELNQLERVAKDFEKEATRLGKAILPDNSSAGGFWNRIFNLGGSTIPNAAVKDLTKQGTKAGDIFGGGFIGGIGKVVLAAGPALIPAIAALLVELLAVVNTALVTGLGLGGVAIGIVGAFRDPMVKAAAADLGKNLKSTFSSATESFVGPTASALHALSSFIVTQGPQFAKVFEPLSGTVAALEKGVEGFISKLLPGLQDGMSRAAPLVEVLASLLPRIGKALGDFLEKITSSVAGNRAALTFLVDLITMIIEGFGNLLQFGSHAFAGLVRVIHPVADILDDVVGAMAKIPGLGYVWKIPAAAIHGARKEVDDINGSLTETPGKVDDAAFSAKSAAPDFDTLASSINKVKQTSDTLAGAMVDKLVGGTLALDKASNDFDKSLITLGDTLVNNGGALSEHVKQLKKTETGYQQNKDAILAVVEANLRVYDSEIQVGVSAEDAAAKYDTNTRALEDQLHAAHFTQEQIDGLIGKYRGVPKNVNTAIALTGLTAAISDLNETLRLINGIKDKTVTVHVKTVFDNPNTRMGGTAQALGGIRRAAFGAIVAPSNPGTLIGEPQTGGEALIPLRGISQTRAAALGQVALGGYGLDIVPRGYRSAWGAGPGSINVTISAAPGGSDLDKAMSSWFMGAVRKGYIELRVG